HGASSIESALTNRVSSTRFHGDRLIPNLVGLVQKMGVARQSDKWKKQANAMVARLDPQQKARLEAMDPNILTLFRDGKLNPNVVWEALRWPDRFATLEDTNRPQVKVAVDDVTAALRDIKLGAQKQGAE